MKNKNKQFIMKKVMSIDVIGNEGDYVIKQSMLIEKIVIKMLTSGINFNIVKIFWFQIKSIEL